MRGTTEGEYKKSMQAAADQQREDLAGDALHKMALFGAIFKSKTFDCGGVQATIARWQFLKFVPNGISRFPNEQFQIPHWTGF